MIVNDAGRITNRVFQTLNALLPFIFLASTQSHSAFYNCEPFGERGSPKLYLAVNLRGWHPTKPTLHTTLISTNMRERGFWAGSRKKCFKFLRFQEFMTVCCPQHSPVENLLQLPSYQMAKHSSSPKKGRVKRARHSWFSPPSSSPSPAASLQK